MSKCAQIQPPVRDAWLLSHTIGDVIPGDDFEFIASIDDGYIALFAAKIDQPVCSNRRRNMSSSDTIFPDFFARIGIDAVGNACVGDHVDSVLYQQRSCQPGIRFVSIPLDV